ncbi:hypothetical protein ACFYXN_18285 [Streptomyces griseus]|uniref:hypothetical protein n=1 Tax=Streptomyces griseus TaxID=1911 RepID=UPI003687F784
MTSEAPRRPRIQHVTTAGSALAVTLLPLVVGALLAKTMAADPMTSVNALVTSGGHRPRVSPREWRRCGGHALRRLRPADRAALRPADRAALRPADRAALRPAVRATLRPAVRVGPGTRGPA